MLTGYSPSQSQTTVPQTLPKIYRLPSADFHDITSGSNGYNAGPGYDLVTGMGSPVANLMVPDLINDTPTPAQLRISATNLKSGGNPITYASPGQTVTVQPTIVDIGQVAASNASIQLLSSTPGVTIVPPSTQSLGTVNPGTPIPTGSAFRFSSAAASPT